MTAPDLLPCPFCGGEAHIEQIGDRRQSTIYCCNSCGCRLETGEEWDHGRDWNTRATPAPAAMTPEVRAVIEAAEWALKHISTLPMDEASQAEFVRHRAALAAFRGEVGNE